MDQTVSRIVLPAAAKPPLQVFVNGVPQREGNDFTIVGRELHFSRTLRPDRPGFWRWVLMFFSIAGAYGRDTVDVHYSVGGAMRVATGLEISTPGDAAP